MLNWNYNCTSSGPFWHLIFGGRIPSSGNSIDSVELYNWMTGKKDGDKEGDSQRKRVRERELEKV
jgi:hypothetical protein